MTKMIAALALLATIEFAAAGLQEFLQSHYDNYPWVITTKGGVVGRTIEALNESTPTKPYTKTYAFQGIPFAKPPVGNLRFASPVEADPWFVKNTSAYGPHCTQRITPPSYAPYPRAFGMEYYGDTTDNQSEDCLFINVFSPNTSYFAKLPVFFMVHGGGFEVGSGDYYNAEAVAENLASRGIVVVTFNYRLAMFGYLYTEDGVASGDYGTQDQELALKWTHENIRRFGGDPDKVTVFGFSAGCVAASLLSISESSLPYYRGSILMGGSAWRQFVGDEKNAVTASKSSELAANANCSSTTDGATVIECLRALTVEQVMYADPMRGVNGFAAWVPVVHNKRERLEARVPKPTLIGSDGNEFSLLNSTSQTKEALIAEAINFAHGNYFPANGDFSTIDVAIESAYNIDAPDCVNKEWFYQELINNVKGDDKWHCGAYLDAHDVVRKNETAYLYNFEFPCDACPYYDRPTVHGDTMVFLMGKHFFARIYDLNEKDLEMSELVTNFFVNFVKTQNPNSELPSGIEPWNPVTIDGELQAANFYDFQPDEQTNKDDYYPHSRLFWANLMYKLIDQSYELAEN